MSSPVLTFGFGSFGSINLLPTLGFGGAPVATQPHGVIVRRGKFFLWPEWEQEQAAILEEARITGQMEQARAQRDLIVAQLREAKTRSSLVIERDRVARQILDIQQRAKAEIRRMERERSAARHRRMEFTQRLKKIRADQEKEDILTISFIVGDLYDD